MEPLGLTSDIALRLVAGTIAGGLIGWQRRRTHKAVGIRTLGLIGLSCALVTVMASHGELADASNAGRVTQGLLSGVGFLGAGVIIQGRHRVHGLTTAAAIWLTAVLGAGAGLGLYGPVALATVLGVVLLMLPDESDRQTPQA